MKQGNQFYLEIQIYDSEDNLLDVGSVEKVQFVIQDLVKIYDGISSDISYDENKKCFVIYLTEDETFNFKEKVKIDVRIMYKKDANGNNTINGTYIDSFYWYDCLKQIKMSDGEV